MIRCHTVKARPVVVAQSIVVIIASLLAVQIPARAEERLPKQLKGITIGERLGKTLDLNLEFVDESGQRVRLAKYFNGEKPVLLTLNYYRCKTLCSLQLNAVVAGLTGLAWVPGDKFRVVTISIDPRDTPAVAKGKRDNYLRALGKKGAEWHFLSMPGGDPKADPAQVLGNAKKVADAVGFSYSYVKKEDQYAHPTAIYFISPKGKISRYLYGVSYAAQQIKFALVEASAGRVGSTIDKIILSCFHYDATVGQYGPFAFGIMRLGGALTALALGSVLTVLWRRDRSRQKRQRSNADKQARELT